MLSVLWRLWAHRCQPNTAQGSFLAVCQKQRSPRVWARLCGHSRGEGRAKSLHYPTRRIVQIAGYRGGRLRRSAELPQPGYRAGNTAHRGCNSWREPTAGLRAYRRGPALFWLRRRLEPGCYNGSEADRIQPSAPNKTGVARRRGRRRPRDTAGRKRGTEKNEHG